MKGLIAVVFFLFVTMFYFYGNTYAVSPTPTAVSFNIDSYTQGLKEVDKNIKQIQILQDKVRVDYEQNAKILGFIPKTFTLSLLIDIENKKVEVTQPWWLIAAKNNVSVVVADIRNKLDSLSSLTTPEGKQGIVESVLGILTQSSK